MNKEGLKEKISWYCEAGVNKSGNRIFGFVNSFQYRHLFTFTVAINFACVGWFVGIYDKPFRMILALDLLWIFLTSLGIGIIIYKIRKHIKILGDK